MVTGPTEKVELRGGEGWGPGTALVGMAAVEREALVDAEDTSLAVSVEVGGDDTAGTVWTGGGEIFVGDMLEMLACANEADTDERLTPEPVWDWGRVKAGG